MNRKAIAMLTALFITAGAALPVYADSELTVIYEDIEAEDDIITEDDCTADGSEDDTAEAAPAEVPTEEQSAADASLTAVEEEYLVADWYEWDAENGVLTLNGQLPDTKFSSIAGAAGISDSSVKKIIVTEGTKCGTKASCLFYNMKQLTEIQGLENLDTSSTTVMNGMFFNCISLTSLDLSGFDTSKVTDMENMFYRCEKLTKIIVSDKWTTDAVTNSDSMFADCYVLRGGEGTVVNSTVDKTYAKIDKGTSDPGYLTASSAPAPSGWYTWDSSTSTLYLRNQLPATTGPISSYANIDQRNVRKIVIADGTKTGNSAKNMFMGMSNLTQIQGLAYLDTSAAADMSGMFLSCSSLASLDLSGFNTADAADMSDMFKGCATLRTLDISKFNTSKATDMSSMFADCTELRSVKLSGIDTSKVTDMSNMFQNCSSLTSLDLSGFKTSSVTTMEYMFFKCSELTSLDLSKFDTSKVTTMNSMFAKCNELRSVKMSKFDTSKVTTMRFMFLECYKLNSLDLSSFNTAKLTETTHMFDSCTLLQTIKVSDRWSNSAVTNSFAMFTDCIYLKGGAGTEYNKFKTDISYARVDKGTSDPRIFYLCTLFIVIRSCPCQANCNDKDSLRRAHCAV